MAAPPDASSTMRAWQMASPGHVPSQLRLRTDVRRPQAKDLGRTDILVRIAAASLNPADHAVPALGLVSRLVFSYPCTSGMDLAGLVVAVGAQVTDVQAGDRVVGRLNPLRRPGSLSEYAVLQRAGYSKLAAGAGGGGVSYRDAAALGTAGLTAYQSIVPYLVHDSSGSSSNGGVPAQGGDVAGGGGDVGGEAATTTVFINSGSGGTGTYMIQIAKLLGCHVTVSCSTAKAPLCRSLGADAIIDYKTSDVVAELARRGRHVFDLVIDNVGYSPANLYAECTRARVMKPAAVFVVVTGNPLAIVSWLRPAFLGGGTNRMVMYLTRARRPDLDQLTRWLDDGKLRSVVDRTFAFEDAREAFAYLMQGSAAGKVVVRVAADLE